MTKLSGTFKNLSPQATVVVLLGLWWIINVVQSAFTGLADDEAYYFMFSQNLDWGYFDHPPLTAVLIRMGSFLGGTLGVRFFVVLLQPLYLYILYRIVDWQGSFSRNDAVLFTLVAAALPIMQLYGLVAVPDAALLMSTALFLLFYKRFVAADTWLNTLLLGLSVALMAYSKYQGALVVLFALASNPRLLLRWRLYVAGLVAVACMLPHLWWQYQHQWVSLRYHLSDRNAPFRFNYIVEYLLNMLAVFNPLFFFFYLKGASKWQPKDAVGRALLFILVGFLGFFLFSSVRGHVQPQWVIPITFALIPLLILYVRHRPKYRRFVVVSSWITLGLVVLLRIEMVFNPLGIKHELFNNEASYGAIAQVANGRPVIFSGRYPAAAKYIFYTGGEAYTQPSVWYRSSQWEYRDDDTRAAGRPAILETWMENADSSIVLANGKTFYYNVTGNFRPVRKVSIGVQLPTQIEREQGWPYTLEVYNPYDYAIELSPARHPLLFVMRYGPGKTFTLTQDVHANLAPHSTTTITGTLQLPAEQSLGKCNAGFAIGQPSLPSWFNSEHKTLEIK